MTESEIITAIVFGIPCLTFIILNIISKAKSPNSVIICKLNSIENKIDVLSGVIGFKGTNKK